MPLEAMQSHVNQVAKRVELLEGVAAMGVPDHSAYSEIQAAEDDVFPIVLDEGQNFATWGQFSNVFNLVVDGGILQALHGVCEDLSLDGDVFESHLTSRVTVALN